MKPHKYVLISITLFSVILNQLGLTLPSAASSTSPIPSAPQPILMPPLSAAPVSVGRDTRALPKELSAYPELIERRTANSATFKVGERRYTSIIAAEALHYLDARGVWQIIDPTFRVTQDSFLVERNSIRGRAGLQSAWVSAAVNQAALTWQATTLGAVFAEGKDARFDEMTLTPLADQLPQAPNLAELLNEGRTVSYSGGWSDPTLTEKLISAPDSLEQVLVLAGPPASTQKQTPRFLEMRATLKLLPGATLWAEGEQQSSAFHTQGQLEIHDAKGKTALVFAPVRAFEQARPDIGVMGDYVAYPTGKTGTWTIGVRTPWRWWVDPARRYPAVLDPTMKVLQTVGYGGGLAWVCNNCTDSSSQSFQFGQLILGSFSNSGAYRGYIQFNNIPFMLTNNPISVTSASLEVSPSSVIMPYYQFEEGQFPDWEKYWTQKSATLYDLGQCPGACNGFSLAGGSFPGGLNWNNSPQGSYLGSQTLSGPPLTGGNPETTSWDVTNRVRAWNKQYPRPADGPAFRLSVNTNCPTSDFVDSDDNDYDDDNGQYVPECTRFVIPFGSVQLKITYDAFLMTVGQSFVNQPGVPSYQEGVFKDTTTNHQYDLAVYAGLPRWRAVAARANHAIEAAASGWVSLKVFHNNISSDLIELANASTNAADITAYALIDDHNPTSPNIGTADLRAEVIASNQNNFATDETRNYRIDYAKATEWQPQLSTRFTQTLFVQSDHLIDLREFALGVGETVQLQVMMQPTATIDLALVRPTSGSAIGNAVRSNNTNADGLNTNFSPNPLPPNAMLRYVTFSPSVSGMWALAFVNRGRPIQHPTRFTEGVSWPVIVTILRCPEGTIPTDKYDCQPVILPHASLPVPFNFTTPMTTALGLTLYSEGGFSGTVTTQLCTMNEQQGTPIIGPMVGGRYVAVAQGSVCYNAATSTLSTTVDSGVLLVITNTTVFADGTTRGLWPSYVLNYGGTIYPLPPNYPTGVLTRTAASMGLDRLEPTSKTGRIIDPFARWDSVFTRTADYINTANMKAHGDGYVTTAVVINSSEPPTVTTWTLPWNIFPDKNANPEVKYTFAVTPNQTLAYPFPTNLAGLQLRILSPTVSALTIADYNQKDLGPDTAQFRANLAKITHDPKLGGASKEVQAVVQPPGEPRQPDLIKSCGATRSCLDLRRDNYVWQGDVKVWDLPDVHIQDNAGSLVVSRPGHLQIFSDDHPGSLASPEDVNQSFSMDTWSVSVSVKDEACVEGGPEVTVVTGEGFIALPMMGNDGASGPPSIAVNFKLCEAKLDTATLILDISPASIPVGSSGVGVYLIGGTVTIDPDHTEIELKLGFETLDGTTLSDGVGVVTIDTRGMFSLQASATLVAMLDANLLLQVAWNPLDVLLDASVSCCGQLISGNLHMHAWIGQGWQHAYPWLPDDEAFHFSGSIEATLFIPEGYVADLGLTSLPPFDFSIGVKIAFGEFCTNSSCTQYAWGMSAVLTIIDFDVGLYVDTNGPEFILGTDDHVLIDQFQSFPGPMRPEYPQPQPNNFYQIIQPGNWQVFLINNLIHSPVDDWPQVAAPGVCNIQPTVHTCPFNVNVGVGRALFTASWQNGNPVVVLIKPDNTIIGPNNAAANGVFISTTQTSLIKQVVYAVKPVSGTAIMDGTWRLRLGSIGVGLAPGINNNYKLLFAADPPAPTLTWNAPLVTGTTPSGGFVNLQWTALRGGQPLTASSKIELFYTPAISKPITATEFAGIILASQISATLGSYQWDTRGLASGEYAVGGRVDDHLNGNGAVVAWAPGTIVISDTTPPPVPTIITPLIPLKDALIVRWQRDDATLDLAGYLVQYTIPDWDVTRPQLLRLRRILPRGPSYNSWLNIWYYGEERIRLGGLLNGEIVQVCVRSYDASGNVSGCTPFAIRIPIRTPDRTDKPSRVGTTVTGVGGPTTLAVNWDPSRSAVGYLVSYHAIGCRLPAVQNVADQGPSPIDVGNVLDYRLTGLTPGQKYWVAVSAYDASGYPSLPIVTTTLLADPTDGNGDGLSDQWATLYRVVGGSNDPDLDGLTNDQEYMLGSHPLHADSDGDAYYDNEETGDQVCGAGHPPAFSQPRLTLSGKGQLNFAVASEQASARPEKIFVFNLGAEGLTWSANPSAGWITLNTTSGGDLSTLLIGVNAAGLAPGKYSGQVDITSVSSGLTSLAATTPETATITVQMEVLPPKQYDMFLPLMVK